MAKTKDLVRMAVFKAALLRPPSHLRYPGQALRFG